jgi:hypothetical protein
MGVQLSLPPSPPPPQLAINQFVPGLEVPKATSNLGMALWAESGKLRALKLLPSLRLSSSPNPAQEDPKDNHLVSHQQINHPTHCNKKIST